MSRVVLEWSADPFYQNTDYGLSKVIELTWNLLSLFWEIPIQ
jgi:hypothetical protein